jgi:hypothetical protein
MKVKLTILIPRSAAGAPTGAVDVGEIDWPCHGTSASSILVPDG